MKTVEVDGIKVEIDEEILKDDRVLTLMGDLDDETLEVGERIVSQSQLLRIVFGRKQRDRIMNEIAEKNGGSLIGDAFSAWWIKFLTAVNAKN